LHLRQWALVDRMMRAEQNVAKNRRIVNSICPYNSLSSLGLLRKSASNTSHIPWRVGELTGRIAYTHLPDESRNGHMLNCPFKNNPSCPHFLRAKQAPQTSARLSAKQTQHLLPRYALCQFRPALDPCGAADAPQFAWLDLVQPAAADTAFAAQLAAGHLSGGSAQVAVGGRPTPNRPTDRSRLVIRHQQMIIRDASTRPDGRCAGGVGIRRQRAGGSWQARHSEKVITELL